MVRNRGGVAGLDEEQRMNLVARAIEAARQVDEHNADQSPRHSAVG